MYHKNMFLVFSSILVLICLSCGCANNDGPGDPYIDAKNDCLYYAKSVLPSDASVFDYIVEVSEIPEDYDTSDFTYVGEGNASLLVRIGGDETQHTDGSDNCYVDLLYDMDSNVIIAYRITMK